MPFYKNLPTQKIAVYAFDPTVAAGTDPSKTGDAANITAQISKDGGASAATNDANPTELDAVDHPGIYIFDMTQAESDADLINLTAVSATSNILLDTIAIFPLEGVEDDSQGDKRLTAKWLENTPLSGGNLLTLNYVFSTTTTAADPGSGRVRFNNATPASVTEIYISEITDGSLFVGGLFADMKAGDKMAIAEEGDATKFISVTLDSAPVDGGGFFTITVTIVDSGTLIGNNRSCGVLIIRESQPVSVEQIRGDAQSAIDLKDFVDAGYDPGTNQVEGVKLVDLTTANSDVRGTDNAATEAKQDAQDAIITEVRLAELDAANLPTDIDLLKTNIPDVLSLVNIKAEVDNAFTTPVADSVAADGVLPTREQYMYMTGQFLMDFKIVGTVYTARKVGGADLMTFELDDDTNPTEITRT